jgi:hypothetical protein
MDRLDDGFDEESGEFFFGFDADEDLRRKLAKEAGWPDHLEDELLAHAMLFDTTHIEAAFASELRLTELWSLSHGGAFLEEDYRELTTLIFEATELHHVACVDCAAMGKDNVSGNWAVANTGLCKGHLRYRLMTGTQEDGTTYRRI